MSTPTPEHRPRISPTVTPASERWAADAVIDRAASGISEREALADVSAHLQLDREAELRVGVVASVGLTAREAGIGTPIGLVAGQAIATAFALVGRAVEVGRAAGVLAPEQVRTADEAGVMLQQLMVGIVDAIGGEATVPPGREPLEDLMRARGENAAGLEIGRLWLQMVAKLTKATRSKAAGGVDVEAFGGKAGA